jgi:hypothetical protein
MNLLHRRKQLWQAHTKGFCVALGNVYRDGMLAKFDRAHVTARGVDFIGHYLLRPLPVTAQLPYSFTKPYSNFALFFSHTDLKTRQNAKRSLHYMYINLPDIVVNNS